MSNLDIRAIKSKMVNIRSGPGISRFEFRFFFTLQLNFIASVEPFRFHH